MAKKHTLINWFGSPKKGRVLWVVAFALTALLTLSSMYIADLQEQGYRTSKELLKIHLAQVEESRYKYPVIDVTQNKVYIPEARLSMPLNKISRDVRYDYSEKTLYLSLPVAIGNQTRKDSPTCDKMVALTQSIKVGSDYTLVSTVPSTDSGFRFVFRHTACSIYPDSMSEVLAETAKKIQPY